MKKFANNPDVQFGDVVLSGGGPRGGDTANPGSGGWPTIRYYNKETGVEGKSYVKKTSMAMCSELGPEGDHYLQDYVEEAAGTSLCSLEPPYAGCCEKEIKFIKKMDEKPMTDVVAQISRLEGMAKGKMKAELKIWVKQRLAILKKMSQVKADPEEHAEL